MLPDVPEIRDSLETLELIEATPDHLRQDQQVVIVAHPINAIITGGNAHFSCNTFLVLRQRETSPIHVAPLVRRCADAMAKQKHAYTENNSAFREHIAAAFLAVAILLRRTANTALETVNAALAKMIPFRLAQWAVLPVAPQDASQCPLGPFTYSRLDTRLFQDRCKRADSNDWAQFAARLDGRGAIFRDVPALLACDAKSLDCGTMHSALHYRAFEAYFSAVSMPAWDIFFKELARQQAVYGAVGVATFPLALEREQVTSDWISAFTQSAKGGGWVVAHRKMAMLEIGEPKYLEQAFNAVDRGLGLDQWGRLPLDRDIQRFCGYISTAQDLERESRFEEALLHAVFAMDLLLGGDPGEQLTKLVSERTAVLVSGTGTQTYQDTITLIQDCYELRSGYAHRGERGSVAELQIVNKARSLLEVAAIVLAAACFARRQAWARDGHARKAWVKQIDLIRAHLAAGFPREQIQGVDLGLDRINLTPTAPSRVSIDWE